MAEIVVIDDGFWTKRETADYLRISERALERLEFEGRGPPRAQLMMRKVVYPRAGVKDWAAARIVNTDRAA